jgi:hypothetical protein
MAHLIQARLIVTAVITATFLPFVAGDYDPLAVPLSTMAWILRRAGLLLVPTGGHWLWASGNYVPGARPTGWLVWITVGTCAFISFVMFLIAFASSGVLLAIGTAAIAGLPIIDLARRLRTARQEPAISRMAAKQNDNAFTGKIVQVTVEQK